MFEKVIQILESVLWGIHHHLRRAPADLDREIRPAVPGVYLAHAGEIEPGDGRLNRRDVPGMVDQGDRLGVARAEQPGLPDPIR